MHKEKAEVSVIIPVYNAEKYLDECVESALACPEVYEVILVEDGSPDQSIQVCERLVSRYEKVKLYRHPENKNKGAGASRNLGIKNAKSKYVTFLDADDYFTVNCFKVAMELFASNEDCDAVYGATGVEYADEQGAAAWRKKGWDSDTITTVNRIIQPDDLFDFLTGYKKYEGVSGYFHINSMVIKRQSLDETKVFFPEELRLHQDTAFMVMASYFLKCYTGSYKVPVAIRRVHSQNRFITHNNLNDSKSLQFRTLRNWSIKNQLPKGYIKFFNRLYIRHFILSEDGNRVFKKVISLAKEVTTRKYLDIRVFKTVLKQLLN